MANGLLGVGLALASASCYDAGYLLEKGALSRVPSLTAERRAVRMLAASPRWLAGAAAMLSGLALRFVALTVAPVGVVQPVLVGGTVAIVPAARLVLGERVTRRESAAIAALTLGVVAVAIAASGDGVAVTRPAHDLALGLMVLAAGAVILACRGGLSESAGRVGAVVSVALCYGTGAVAEKGVAVQVSEHGLIHGCWAALATADPWLFLVTTAAGLALFQVAMQRQPVAVLVPATNGLSSAWAVAGAALVFSERWPHHAISAVALACGYLALAVGVVTLHRTGSQRRPAVGVEASAATGA